MGKQDIEQIRRELGFHLVAAARPQTGSTEPKEPRSPSIPVPPSQGRNRRDAR